MYGAQVCCEWAGARAADRTEMGASGPWGNSELDCTNASCYVKGDGRCSRLVPAQTRPTRPLNMAANMCERVTVWCDKYYWSDSPDRKPQGLCSGDDRCARGASFMSRSYMVRALIATGAFRPTLMLPVYFAAPEVLTINETPTDRWGMRRLRTPESEPDSGVFRTSPACWPGTPNPWSKASSWVSLSWIG